MSHFSKLLPLSDKAFDLYSQSLGRYPLSYQELNSLMPDISSEDFGNIIEQLLEMDLMFKEAGITFDDMHEYVREKYNVDNDDWNREDVMLAISKIKEWKNDRNNY